MVFPEGERGFVKPYTQRYQLQRFGLGVVASPRHADLLLVTGVFWAATERTTRRSVDVPRLRGRRAER